jgi:hypothetical protein
MELPNRDEHEAAIATALATVAQRHRHEIAELMGNVPDMDHVPEGFWQRMEDETAEAIQDSLLDTFSASSHLHGWGHKKTEKKALREVRQGISDAALAAYGWATDRARAFARYWIDVTQAEHEQASQTPRAITSGEFNVLLDATFSPQRIETVAIDEVTRARHAGAETARDATVGLGGNDRWRTQRDDRVCHICEPNEGKRRDDWPAKFAEGPPCHPRCRCWIEYQDLETDQYGNEWTISMESEWNFPLPENLR